MTPPLTMRRMLRETDPFHKAGIPSFCTVSLKQCHAFRYRLASIACIRVLITSNGIVPSGKEDTETLAFDLNGPYSTEDKIPTDY
jgi:hypothetical protein